MAKKQSRERGLSGHTHLSHPSKQQVPYLLLASHARSSSNFNLNVGVQALSVSTILIERKPLASLRDIARPSFPLQVIARRHDSAMLEKH